MLDRIITWSLRHRFAVIAAALVLVALGFAAMNRLEIDAFPDTTPVQVQINTVSASLSPEEAERQITLAIEAAIGGLPRLAGVRSISKFGLSQVVVTFEDRTDVWIARH